MYSVYVREYTGYTEYTGIPGIPGIPGNTRSYPVFPCIPVYSRVFPYRARCPVMQVGYGLALARPDPSKDGSGLAEASPAPTVYPRADPVFPGIPGIPVCSRVFQ